MRSSDLLEPSGATSDSRSILLFRLARDVSDLRIITLLNWRHSSLCSARSAVAGNASFVPSSGKKVSKDAFTTSPHSAAAILAPQVANQATRTAAKGNQSNVEPPYTARPPYPTML